MLMRSALFWGITRRRVVIVYRGESWPLKMGPIRCPETSVNSYHTMPRNIPEERRSQFVNLSSSCKMSRYRVRELRLQTFYLWINPKALSYIVAMSALEHTSVLSMLASDWSVLDRCDWGWMQSLSLSLTGWLCVWANDPVGCGVFAKDS